MANKEKNTKMTSAKSKSSKRENRQKPVWSCDYCQKKFSRSSNLKSHVTVHTGQKGFHCNLCDFSCSQKGNLQNHIRRHLNERPFKCQEPNCEGSFPQYGDLTRHQLVHNKNDKSFSCSSCPFKTHKKTCLMSHMKFIHSKSRPLKCPHENCEFSAKQKSQLTQHSKIHSEEKNQVCSHPNCGFRTKLQSYLKIHIKTHLAGEKRFRCNFCDFESNHHSNLVVHIRRHTGETPFACQLCPYKSKDKSHLNLHMKVHAD